MPFIHSVKSPFNTFMCVSLAFLFLLLQGNLNFYHTAALHLMSCCNLLVDSSLERTLQCNIKLMIINRVMQIFIKALQKGVHNLQDPRLSLQDQVAGRVHQNNLCGVHGL